MDEIQPIETRYAGHRFRSRLEARWAVLLDSLRIRWQYEPQGFIINGRRYLPDFWLPDLGVWVEVKGSEDKLDREFMQTAAGMLPGGILIFGPIFPPLPDDEDWAWLYLPRDEPPKRVSLGASAHKGRLWYTYEPFPDDWTEPGRSGEGVYGIADAYAAALSARFEWGETP